MVCSRHTIKEKYLFPLPTSLFFFGIFESSALEWLPVCAGQVLFLFTIYSHWQTQRHWRSRVGISRHDLRGLWLPLVVTSYSWSRPHPMTLRFHFTVSSWLFSTGMGPRAKGQGHQIVKEVGDPTELITTGWREMVIIHSAQSMAASPLVLLDM